MFTAGVVAADPDAEVPWLATAYVPAPSLEQLVQTCGPLPVPVVRWLAACCAEALDSIHEAGLVHRDLKPSNVLVSLDGPRVIDFGVARAVERTHLTSSHGTVGTPAYMAPEQARDTRDATAASDVFSLGSTLLFAATGHPPYRGKTVTDILVRLQTEPADLSGLPAELTEIVSACLQRDPSRRPTPAALLAELSPVAQAGDRRRFGPSALSASALAMIEEYRQAPQPDLAPPRPRQAPPPEAQLPPLAQPRPAPDPEAEAVEEDTIGSQVGSDRSGRVSSSWPSVPQALPAAPSPSLPPSGAGPGNAGWRAGRIASVVISIGAVLALLMVGGIVGAWIGGDAGRPGQDPLPADGGPGGGPPPDGHQRGKPYLGLSQPTGDGATTFVVFGYDYPPDKEVTIRLSTGQEPPYKPTADRRGRFAFAVDQGHVFFPGKIPPGDYTVLVTAGQAGDRVSFHVDR